MQAGSRRGGRARLACIDRLVAFGVFQGCMNIRWQGNIPDLWKKRLDGFLKPDQAFRAIQYLYDFGLRAVLHAQFSAYTQTLAAYQCLPIQAIPTAKKQQLDPPSGYFSSVDAGRDDARLVQNQQIARTQIFADLPKDTVLDLAGVAMQHQQARRIARLDRRLGDEGFRQVVIEIGSVHGISSDHFNRFNERLKSLLRSILF